MSQRERSEFAPPASDTPIEQPVTIAPGQTVTVNLALAAASVTLDQTVIVGYGTQRRSDLTAP